jgi:hypothetical protein
MAVVNHEMAPYEAGSDPCGYYTSGCVLGNKVNDIMQISHSVFPLNCLVVLCRERDYTIVALCGALLHLSWPYV